MATAPPAVSASAAPAASAAGDVSAYDAVLADPSASLVAKTEAFVKKAMATNDASHDFTHVDRVRRTALRLAAEEGVADLEVVEVGALLHDVFDYKYSGSETKSSEAAGGFLTAQGYAAEKIATVQAIIDGVGFKSELGKPDTHTFSIEVQCVQDADRLDAIGAIGVARCLTYGAVRGRPLYDPDVPPIEHLTQEAYAKSQSNSINHFYEKLLKLKDMMKTDAGKRTAAGRHTFMESFLDQFKAEWEGLR